MCTVVKSIIVVLLSAALAAVSAAVSVASAGYLFPAKHSVGLQLFMKVENSDAEHRFMSLRHECCLLDARDDCEHMYVYGPKFVTIPANNRVTLIFVYPTVIHYNKKGHCRFIYALDSWCDRRRKSLLIDFDTRLSSRRGRRAAAAVVRGEQVASCRSLDEDPLAGCRPLDCELKYNGERAFFNATPRARACERSPLCLPRRAPPDRAVDPAANRCRQYRARLSFEDIAAIVLRASNTTARGPAPGSAMDYSRGYEQAGMSVLYYVLAVCFVLIVFLFVLTCIIWLCGKSADCSRRRRDEVKRGLLRDVMMTSESRQRFQLVAGRCERGCRGGGGASGGGGVGWDGGCSADTSFIARPVSHSDSSDGMP